MKNFLLIATVLIISSANAQLKSVAYSDGAQKLSGVGIAPAKPSTSKPGILILPAWKGITAHERETAESLSALGYYAFIADIYGEGKYPKDAKEAGEQSGFYKKNYMDYQRRIQLALDQLVKAGAAANNIVIMGYCFGGTGVLEAARGGLPVNGVVSIHGGLGKDASRANVPIKTKVLVLHGADDPYVPATDITSFQQEMRDGNADWQMVYYADAVHSFTEKTAGTDKSKGAAYNAKADKRSWEHLKLFLSEVLTQ
ncbi:MAG TPA: dienelactone hydrolase family protein [Flavobacterium sp.]|jgi:dienelactone hydrolase